MGLDDFVDEFSNDELRELALDVANNDVSADREQRLFELLAPTSMEARQAAADERPALVDLLVNLGLQFRFPGEPERAPIEGDGELAGRAIDILERPDGLAAFLREFSDAGLRSLSDEIGMGQTTEEQESRLRGLLEGVADRTLREAVEDRRPLESVLAGLGVPVPTVEIEEIEEPARPEREPGPPTPGPPRGRRQPEVGRPSPFGAEADKEVADRFFGGNFAKGNAWVTAEQERLSRFAELSPREFWERRGDRVWGGILSRREFVEPGAE